MTEVLRVPPYPITTTWTVPDANTDYTIYVEDLVDHSFETTPVTSNADSEIEYVLPRAKVQFDRQFLFQVLDETNEIVVDSNLTVYRPYIDPNTLGTTPAEVFEYQEWEIIARSIIDAYVGDGSGTGGGFYNHKLIIQQVGQGTDYFPIWHDTNKVLKVYENNVLVYDAEDTETVWPYTYKVTLDNSAIIRVEADVFNRIESRGSVTMRASGDLGFSGRSGAVAFPKGVDYIFILDAGFKAVPPDVELAAKILINDLKCGDNEYYKRWTSQYSTDQFDIKFAPQFLEGTGNNIVDKILSNYKGNLLKPGMI